MPLLIQEHRSHAAWCTHCRQMHQAPLPPAIRRGGLVGPTLTTLIADLKGTCHASFSTIRRFLVVVVGVTLWRGELAPIIAKTSRALEQPYQELLDLRPEQTRPDRPESQWRRAHRGAGSGVRGGSGL